MGVLIDASILIQYERGHLDFERHVTGARDELFLSVITVTELLQGAHRAQNVQVREKRIAFVEAIFTRFPILPVDLETARAHSRLWAGLAAVGSMIGPNDLWLAATAIRHGLAVVTANVREFRRVPDLTVELWQ